MSTPLLTPADRAALQPLQFSPGARVTGHYAGRHASPQRGSAVEFRDYRAYTPGDAPSAIDWKVYGRSDRLVVKQYDHQTDLTVHLVVDASASMAYAGALPPAPTGGRLARLLGGGSPSAPPPSKLDHARRLAAALAFVVIHQQDRAGVAVAQNGAGPAIDPAASWPHLHRVTTTLERLLAGGSAGLAAALAALDARTRRRGVVVVFSDLADPPGPVIEAANRLTHRGHEVIVFQTLHPDELSLPDLSDTVFVDSETGDTVHVQVEDIRDAYAERARRRVATWRRQLAARGATHRLVPTDTPPTAALRDFLFHRSAR